MIRHTLPVKCAAAVLAFLAVTAGAQTNYYINDTNTAGDVYTTAIGGSGNNGQSPATPMDSLQRVLDTYDLGPGDTIWVDTGRYRYTGNFAIWTNQDSGSFGVPLVLQGSTNAAAGGSMFDGSGGPGNATGLYCENVDDLVVRNLELRAMGYGAYLINSDRFVAEDLWVVSNNVLGIQMGSSPGARFNRCAAIRCYEALTAPVQATWENGLIWRSTYIACNVGNGGSLKMRSSIVVQDSGYVYAGAVGGVTGDYNVVSLSGVAVMAYTTSGGEMAWPRLSDYQKAFDREWNSASLDPAFAGAAALDFHLKSEAGRYVPGSGWTNDVVTSPAVDFGDPAAAFTNEPLPNGSRINAGVHGNSAEASLSRTNAWLLALTYNEGGLVSGLVRVAWAASRILATTETVRVDYSLDGGATWSAAGAGIPVFDESFTWDSTAGGSSGRARWRVVLESDTNVSDAVDAHFTIHNSSLNYYVNDASTSGDVYVSAVGHATNTGTTASEPMDAIQRVIDAYGLGPGDTIWVDTGTYASNGTAVTWYSSDRGASGNPITLQGSTNDAAGGTRMDCRGPLTSYGIYLNDADDVAVRHVQILGATYGMYLQQCDRLVTEHMQAQSNQIAITLAASPGARFSQCAILHCFNGMGVSQGTLWENGLFFNNVNTIINNNGTSVRIRNSVIAQNQGRVYYSLPGNVTGEYNVIYLTGSAQMAESGATVWPRLADYQLAFDREWRSTSMNPLFADDVAHDFHLKSASGRLVTGAGWTNDAVTSPAIDLGDPASAYANELDPNGGRINAGFHGNTGEASKSRTNAWLLALTFNEGGAISGTGKLAWVASTNLGAGATVRIDYSADAGETWQVAMSGLVATQEVTTWDTTVLPSSARAKWRVVWEADTNVWDAVDSILTVRNGGAAFDFYVNDTGTAGDVYTTAAGSPTNTGTSAADPMATLQPLLDLYDLGPGDRVFIDTGYYYTPSVQTYVGASDQGAPGNPVVLIGSTNKAAGGSVLDRGHHGGGSAGLYIDAAADIEVRHLTLRGGNNGLFLWSSVRIHSYDVLAFSNDAGFAMNSGSDMRFVRCTSTRNSYGMNLAGVVRVENCVLWDNTVWGLLADNGSQISVSNSILAQANGVAYQHRVDFISGDHNLFWIRGAAQFAQRNDSFMFPTLGSYQQLYGKEPHSASLDPQLADGAGMDFHPKSEAGRFVPGAGWTNDATTSVAIDFGDPTHAFTNEPAPNGSRINAGPHGNTAEASKSRTNAWLLALTFNEGGSISSTQALRWIAQNFSNGATVRVEYSVDGGTNWSVVAGGIAATSGVYVVSPAALTSSFNGRWRVVSESDTNVLDVSEGALVVNRVPTVFYVNDGATNGDVYTTATGHSLNSGLSPGTPMDTVQRVIDAYDLEPGDEIRVDTAHFTYTGMHFIVTAADQGAPGNPVTIRGSTNDAAGGTVFDSSGAPPNSRVIQLNYSFDMAIRNIRVCGTTYGLDAFDADGLLLEDVVAVSNSAAGITLFGCANVRMVRCVSAANAIGLEVRYSGGNWESGVLWSNTQSAIQLELPSPMFGISNSIIAQGPGYVYRNSPHMVSGDYNIFLMAPGAQLSFDGGLEVHTRLSAYQKTYNREWHSSVFDPLVANPSALDFHLQSAAGRYVSGAGWTNDAATSGAIDFGPPGMAFTNEPAPAGSRVNAGAHANTAQASKSLTNAWLRALTLNDGGSIAGTSYVAWAASRAIGPTNTVRIEVSIDDGGTWSAVASNLAVLSEIYAWDTTLTASSGRSRWRVLLEADTNVADVVDTRFTIHNSALNYYVNDTNPAGDVVTAAPGSSTNTGTAADQPMESLQRVLDTYDLEPGDTVWIDTAFFGSSNTLVNWQSDDIGSQASPLILQGSSNMLAGGTVFQSSNSVGLYFNYAHDVVVRNFTARRCTTGIYAYQCNRILFERFTALSNTQAGMTFYSCPGALVRSSVASRNNLAIDLPTGSLTMDGIVLWKNGSGIYAPAALGYISNSILVADSGQIYSGSIGTTRGDHNVVHLTGSAKFFFDGVTPAPLLSDYQRLTGRELHSTTVDPAFEDPEALDFHLRSTAGRFDPATSSFVTDTNDSPAIDFGNPSAAFAAEPAPNGSRVNAGMHGNTPEASKSRTNAWLLALSFSDGGTISSNETLRWIAQNFTNGATVRIEYSANGGTNWSTVAGGIDATGGVYVVSPASLSSSFNGRWRVVSESDGSVADASDAPIVVNRIPVVFYVNDDSTSGDVYTAAAGNDGYSGLGPSAPMRTMSNLLAKFTLVPGDLVLIDTGVHSNYSFVVAQSGTATNPIVIRGSTNQLAGGTVFDRGNSSAVVITLAGVSYVAIEDLTVKNGQTGVHLPSSTACTLNRIAAVGNVNGYRGEGSSGHRFNRCVAALNSIGYSLFNNDNIWNHGVSWNNGSAFAPFTGSSVSISNSVIVGGQAFAGSAPHAGDYNVFWNTDILPGTYKALSGLQNDKDGWRHSTYADPMYLATTTNLDFHEASPSGRYDPSIAGFVTTDAQFSALIDLGNPASAVGAEQGPNGSRANVGLYGGTLEASKSRTNAWLMALTFNDGGLLRGTGSLYWTSGGLAPTSTVRLEYSGDQGASWSIIATAIPGSNGVYAWNASAVTSTPVAYWKVVNEGDPAVSDTNDSVFAIKGTTNRISYFVNDAVTAGDVYATAAGSAANSGVAPASPKATVQELLAVYDLDAGDIVYVDTGLYVLTNTLNLGYTAAGVPGSVVTFKGSTNTVAGGTVFDRQNSGSDVVVLSANNIRLEDLVVQGGLRGILVIGCSFNEFVHVTARNNTYGFEGASASSHRFDRCVTANNSVGCQYFNSNNTWDRGLSWNNATAFVPYQGDTWTVSNSIVVGGAFCPPTGFVMAGDYNMFWNCTLGGGYATLADVQQARPGWRHSVVADPLAAASAPLDFHLRSSAGRYDISTGTFVVDTNDSPAIDFGNPAYAFSDEPAPNGGRINIGPHGNTSEASKSRTNAWLLALTFSDGGTLRAPDDVVYWIAQNFGTGDTVRIELSLDGGATWVAAASNVSALQGSWQWTNTSFSAGTNAAWRLVSEADTNVSDRTDSAFQYANDFTYYYVNDGSVVGDVYCSAPGSGSHAGLLPSAPKASLQAIFAAYDLKRGDRVFVDTGIYLLTNDVAIGSEDSGNASGRVIVQGGTNQVWPTAFSGGSLVLNSARDVELRNLNVQGADNGVEFVGATNCSATWVQSHRNSRNGFLVSGSVGSLFSHCVALQNATGGLQVVSSSGSAWQQGIVWANGRYGVRADASTVAVGDTVVGSLAANSSAYYLQGGAIAGDYNNLYLRNGAVAATNAVNSTTARLVADWVQAYGQDLHSLSHAPGFADADAGDFHARSAVTQGRFVRGYGRTNDATTSVLVDAGDAAASFALESSPNGSRRDMGLYGDSTESSRSPASARLVALSLNDGGTVQATQSLYWNAVGAVTGQFVTLSFTSDGGATWSNIASGVAAGSEEYVWNTAGVAATTQGIWSVTSETDTNTADQSDAFFTK